MTIRIGFDVGGFLSKYPNVLRPIFNRLNLSKGMIQVLESDSIEVFVVSDMKPHAKAVAICHDNGLDIPPERVLCADYETYGERCKEMVCRDHRIDILIDDHMGYLIQPEEDERPLQRLSNPNPMVRLFVMPNPDLPYYADSWKMDGSEGNFGRRRNPIGSKHPPEDRK